MNSVSIYLTKHMNFQQTDRGSCSAALPMAAAAFTIGSIGDIISLCKVIHGAVETINDSRRAVVEYRSLGKEVLNLSQALEAVRLLLEQESELQRRGDLEKVVSDCRACFVRFLERIKAFECLGRDNNLERSIQILCKRLRWPGCSVSISRTILLFIN